MMGGEDVRILVSGNFPPVGPKQTTRFCSIIVHFITRLTNNTGNSKFLKYFKLIRRVNKHILKK